MLLWPSLLGGAIWSPKNQIENSPIIKNFESIGVLLIQQDTPEGSPLCDTNPLESNTPHGTPKIVPDREFVETYSSIEDWTAKLSKTTPVCLGDSIFPDVDRLDNRTNHQLHSALELNLAYLTTTWNSTHQQKLSALTNQ